MTFWLDHLAAVFVGATLPIVLFLVQQHKEQHAVQATVTHTVQTRTYDFVRTFERDVENMRTEGQARTATGTYTCAVGEVRGTAGSFTFPTLLRPGLGPASSIGHVTYRLENTGRTIRASGLDRPLLRLLREEGDGATTTLAGGSDDTCTVFGLETIRPVGRRLGFLGTELIHHGTWTEHWSPGDANMPNPLG